MVKERVFEMLEVEGTKITGTLTAPKREENSEDVIKELRAIINKKNAVIERQADYIGELQEENSQLRSTVKMLTI